MEIIVIGAGAAGLMAALELARSGKKVTILEARNRIGGRVFPLDEKVFGYPAQGGAEFVHGEASVTKALIAEADLTFIHEAEDGEVWTKRNGILETHKSFIDGNEILKTKLDELQEDMSVSEFLDKNFSDEEYENLRNSIVRMIEGYDAADPSRVSVMGLREGWQVKQYHGDGWIKEGYGKLLNFLRNECEKFGVKIILATKVVNIDYTQEQVRVRVDAGEVYGADKVILTVPLPVIETIQFNPAIPEKLAQVPKIGFGTAIKLIVKFKTQWWKGFGPQNLDKLSFLLGNEGFTAWWTEYPIEANVLIGWMDGWAKCK